ncbi:response regulator (plasmid) [Paraburkholderia sp. FT54]|uniref:response regulator n=1 Tax=Paraburkholderia sp. FT54 TaxID=3074437 RepID=UPI002877AC0D|nr:response regulator [Paraburkholderia sp. FT54]WNC95341.1 response regulator [Paraburkholderia sp. FT54]
MVDDYELGAQAVALALSFAGHEAQFAYGGEEAVRRLAFWIPDMAVLDINMPSPDGFELAATLRGSVATRDVYIIAHTSMDEDEVRAKAGLNDFDAYCQKGAGAAPLMDLISRAQSGG